MAKLTIISESSEAFYDRIEAGQLLAGQLEKYTDKNAVVLGIPRGGIIVARQIANHINADLDIVLTHKLGAPGNPELAIGSISEDGKLFVDEKILSYVGADADYIEREKNAKLQDIKQRVQRCRTVLPKIPLKNRIVIVTDDGVATGATMQAALWAVRQEKPERIVAALPVGPADTVTKLCEYADEMICLRTPLHFGALSRFYSRFAQVEDDELIEILEQENQRRKNHEN